MVFFKPFGYSSSRTVLQICAFWLWTALVISWHLYKIHETRIARATTLVESANENGKVMDLTKSTSDDNHLGDVEAQQSILYINKVNHL